MSERLDGARAPRSASTRIAQAVRAMRSQPQRAPAKDIAEQLAYLERDLQEVRTRVNGLFFAVLTAARDVEQLYEARDGPPLAFAGDHAGPSGLVIDIRREAAAVAGPVAPAGG